MRADDFWGIPFWPFPSGRQALPLPHSVSLQLLPQAGKGSPWRPCWESTAASWALLGQPHGSHSSAQGIPGTNSIEIHPPSRAAWLKEAMKLPEGKWLRTYSGMQCYKDGTRLKTSDQPERAEREKQHKAQTLPCLWRAQSWVLISMGNWRSWKNAVWVNQLGTNPNKDCGSLNLLGDFSYCSGTNKTFCKTPLPILLLFFRWEKNRKFSQLKECWHSNEGGKK